MDNEAISVLKEIRDLQKEMIDNQKKALETVQVQQKAAFKKIFVATVVLLVIFLAISVSF